MGSAMCQAILGFSGEESRDHRRAHHEPLLQRFSLTRPHERDHPRTQVFNRFACVGRPWDGSNRGRGPSPLDSASDEDGLLDGEEVRFGSSPSDPDSRSGPGFVAPPVLLNLNGVGSQGGTDGISSLVRDGDRFVAVWVSMDELARFGESPLGADNDIFITRSDDGGSTWSFP